MFQLNRRVEYVLVIVTHLVTSGQDAAADSDSQPVLHSARSIAESTGIPFDMVTKCLQRLKAAEICIASQGKQGGYRLAVSPSEVSVGQLLAAVFSPVTLAGCEADDQGCPLLSTGCQIRGPLGRLSDRLQAALEDLSLAELLAGDTEEHAGQVLLGASAIELTVR